MHLPGKPSRVSRAPAPIDFFMVPRGIRLSAATNDPVVPPSEPLRLMAVHAHPDDESSKGAATMARYVREGA